MGQQLLEILTMPAQDNWPGTDHVAVGRRGPYWCKVVTVDGAHKTFHGHTLPAAVDLACAWVKSEVNK